MTVFAVRLSVLLALWADREWKARFLAARSVIEVQDIIVAFGRTKGFKVVEVPSK